MISKTSKRVMITLDHLALSMIKQIFKCDDDDIDSKVVRYLVDMGIEYLNLNKLQNNK